MSSTHRPDNSHHSHAANNANTPNTPKHAGTNAGGLRSRSKLTIRPKVRLFAALIAIALIATVLTVTAYMQKKQSASTERVSLKQSANRAANMPQKGTPLAPLATTYFSKAAATDFTNVTSWGTAADGSGASPASISNADDFVIQNGSAMNLNATSAAVRSLTINAGSLTIGSNTLTVTIPSQNNSTLAVNSGGTLTVSGGTLNLNGNFALSTGGAFNQSGGDINVDGNNAGVTATSVASGTAIVAFNTSTLVAVTMTGGTFTIVDPHAATTATNVLTLSGSATGQIAATTAHTLRFGDGVSTDAGGNAVGFQMDPWATTTGLKFGNVVFNGPTGTNRIFTLTSGTFAALVVGGNLTVNSGADFRHTSTTATTGAIYCNGNLTVNSGGTYTDLGTLRLSDGTYSSGTTIGIAASTNAQVVSGTGTFRNLTAAPTANYTSLVINNSNATGVSFSSANSLISGAVTGTVSGTLTWTAGLVSTGANAFILGTGTGALGTLTYTAGGFTTGSTFGRWYAAATGGTTITAATLPTVTGTTGSYPFLVGTNARNFFVNRPTTTGATGGVIRVSHTDGAGVNTIAPVLDGAYSIDRQTNANWTVSISNGFAAGTGTFSYAVSGQGTYAVINGNSRVMKVATVVGTHQTGTTLPHGQRTGIAAASYLGTFYLGVSSADIPVASTQSGAWDDPATWGGTAPVCGNNVVIQSGHTVTVNAAAANAGPVTVNSGGTLVVSGNTLTVGCTLNSSALTNNGTLTVSGGTVAVNGNLAINNGSTFTHSSGSITIDGNDNSGTTGNANSVASGTPLFAIGTSVTAFSTGAVTLSGGTITIVDPHIGSATATSAYSVYGNLSGVSVNAGTGHTFQFGDGVSTAAGSSTSGFVFDGFVGSGRLNFGNVTANSAAGTNRIVTQTTNTNAINGNLTVTLGTISNNALTINIGGNISVATGGNFVTGNGTTGGTVVFALTTGTATAAQTVAQSVSVSGTGTINSNSAAPTANFINLTLNNTSATGVTFNALNNNSGAAGFSGASVLNSLTFTGGRHTTTGGGALLWGTSTVRGTGTMTVTSGGMASGSTFAMGTSAAQTGTTITSGAVPTFSSGGYPFVDALGNSRNMWIQRAGGGGAAGIIGITYTDISGLSTVSIVDGAYTVNTQYNSTWAASTFGTTPSSATFNLAISATNAFGAPPTAANMRITTLAGVLGTHQAGTTLPHAQRTGLTFANLTAQAFYVGINTSDVPYASAATGDWATGATWNKGTVPTSADPVTIAAGHTVTVTTASQASSSLTINSTGGLTVSGGGFTANGPVTNNGAIIASGGLFTVLNGSGTAITNAGTFTVSGGTVNVGQQDNTVNNRLFSNNSGGTLTVSSGALNISGRLLVSLGSAFNQTGGDINVDGNAAGSLANSVGSGIAIVDINPTSLTSVNLTGGTLTIVDPHAATASTTLLVTGATSGPLNVTSAHTIRFGNGTSTDAGGSTNGFLVNTWATTSGMPFGNVTVEGPAGTNRFLVGQFQQPILGNVTVNSGGEFRISTAYINGNLTVNTGGIFTSLTSLRMGNSSFVDGSSVSFAASTNAQTIGGTGTYRNLTASPTASLTALTIQNSNASGVTLADADKSLSGVLTLLQGNVTTTANTLIINSTGSVSRTSGHVVGNLRRTFAATGSLTFDVGTANGYSPVAVNATAGTFPANFTAKATQGAAPYVSGANKLARYWTLTSPGVLTANLTFTYLAGDVTGTVANYKFIKNSSGTLSTLNPTGTPTSTSATINGVSSFSDWTLAEPSAVTSGSLQFSAGTYSAGESDGTVNITATRTGGSDGNVSVDYATVAGGSASGGGTCTGSTDYVNASGTLTWLAGDATVKSFTITICPDSTDEADETVNLQVSNAQGGAALGSPSAATLTITDDDGCLSTITVNDTGDAPDAAIGDGVCATAGAVCTLRAAIAEANTVGACASSVSINITVTGTITLGSALPDITRDMVIDGPGAASLTISGNNATVIGTASHPSPENVTISDVTMTNGRSTNASLAGGFSNNGTGTLNITNVVMSNNAQVALSGGGGALAQTQVGTLNITDSTINNNTAVAAGARGAGVYKASGNINVLRSTFNNNAADVGGAMVLASGGVTTFVNSTFSGNTAVSANAVLLASGGNHTFTNCTITNNSGAGAAIQRASGTVTFKNSIVAQNGSELSGGSFVSLGYNLIGNNTNEETTFPAGTPNANNDYVGTGASPLNARLGPLANNGGPTQTHALLDGSLATDHGSSGLSTDQRGQTRPYDNPFIVASSGGDNSDIGAYEAQTNLAAAETDVAVSGGNLVITDANGGTTADTLTISLNGANVRITDPNNTLTAGAGATQIDPNTVEVPLASIAGGNIQVNTLAGADTLTLALAGGDFIPAAGLSYDGGLPTTFGSGDKLVITGGSQGTVTYNYTNLSDGNIVMSNFGTVSYIGLEPISNSGSATDIIFNLPTGVPTAVTLADDGTGGNTMSRLGGGSFETTDFANPTGSVTINRGNAGDLLTTGALPDLTSSLTIGTGALPFQTVAFGGALTLAADKNLSADSAENINLASAASDIATTGTGTITLTAARSVFLVTGASVTVVNGTLTLNGNQQVTPTADAFTAININGGTVQSTGSGNIVINGKGGTGDFDGQVGVRVGAGGLLTSTGTGTINVTGTGGAFSGITNFGANNMGVLIEGTNSTISSSSASITITGQGGTGAGALAGGLYGVYVSDFGKIQANGAGTVTINGTGGNVTSGGNNNLGEVNSAGVILNTSGKIESTGSGVNAAAVNITAIANAGGDGSSQGLRLDAPATITTVDGPLGINATAGSCAQLCLGFSIRGNVTASGSALIDLTGTGGSGGTSNIGANIRNAAVVSVNTGNLTVTGTGGSGSDNLAVTLGNIGAGTLQSNGTITVAGDSMNIAASGVINAGANAASLRQKTNTVAIDLGSALDSAVSTLELSDAELDRVTAGTLNLGNASSGAITVSAPISRTAATILNLVSGANIDIAGGSLNSAGGNVTLNPGTNVFPSNTGVDVTTGAAATLALTSGKDLKIDIDGTAVDTSYTQLNVAGLVNLNSANLSFAGSTYTPVGGESFMVVNNDGADAITGTFANGPTFTNFLGSGLTATISYTAGDGNDAVLTVAAACVPPAIVYVDDNFINPVLGQDPDGGGPATNFGCDSFATIQDGVNGVATSGTVNVANGLYTENVTIPKALTLTGAGAAGVTLRPAISDPNCGGAGGGSLCAGASNLMLVAANNVTISGLTLDGDNTTLTSGQVFGGADLDARNGIITNHLAGVFNNLEVHHTTVKNIWLRGMYASSGGTFNFHDNIVQNVQANVASIGMFNFAGAGAYTNNNVSACNDAISSNHSRGTTYTGNTVTTSASGIHSDNAGDSGGTPDTIANNTVTNSTVNGYGIWVFVPYKTVTVQNNTVTNVDVGLAVFGDSGVTTTTKPGKDEGDKDARDTTPGRTAPTSANVDEPSNDLWRMPKAFNDGLPGPDAPPVAPFSGSFKGNTVDGQNKANSTGAYFTTSQIGFGSGNPKVEFTTNTVLNNVDGFYLEAETGFTLETAASFNRIVNNTNSQVTQASGVGFAGTLNGSMENNWWGCNAGPGNAGCGVVVGAGVDFNPWIVLGISASPSTIPPGGSTTVTADMTHNSVNAVPSVTEFVPQVAVTFGAVNGTVFPTSGTITNGQATTTFTSNSTSSGSASATVDNQTVSTPITVSAVNTYTWSPTLGTSWILPINWTPTRFLPQTNDTLVINGTTTPAPTITNVPTQTIAGLHLINSAQATLQAGGTSTLTISGMSGSDLTIPAGSFLTLDGSNGLTIKVSAAGTVGTIGGGVAAQGGFHRLFGDAGGGITFQSGGIGTAGPGLTSNMFGTGGAGDGAANSVTFANGSFYFHNAGGSPFGVAPNPAVVVFQTGSLATFLTASGFEASGRTYADLAIGKVDPGGVEVDASASGAGNFQFDNLSVNSTSTADSSLTFTGSGANTITIRGRIDSNGVGIGGTLPDVIFTAGSGGILIDNPGNTLVFDTDSNSRGVDFESSATVTTNTELLLNRKLLVGISQPSSFVLTVNGVLNGSATGYVIGNVKRPVTTPESFIYHVGTPNGYSPLDAVFTAGTGDLTVVARQGAQPVLMSATSLQRYWTLTEGGAVTADLTFHYNSPDVMGTEANYRLVIVESGNATSFPENCPNVACVDESANTIRRTGVQTFSDWTAAEPAAPTAVNLTGFSATRSGDEVRLQWQSGYEARNLGYNIYREQDGKRVAITPALVAGSALVAGNRTRLTAGLSYSWYDRVPGNRGQGTAVRGQKSDATYWLEDVDLNGTRTLHGPIAAAECGAGNADCNKLSERSRLLNELTNRHSAITSLQPNDGVQLEGWPAAVTVPDSHDAEPDPEEMQRTIAGMTGLKVSVSRAGWYRITQPQVLAAGLNIADANGLQLYRDGRQVAFRLSNSSEQFGPADYLEFYGEGLNSGTAIAQTYYLVKLAEPGKRVEVKPQAVSPGDRVSPQGFAYTVERKERMTYFSALLNGDVENFFGQIVSTNPTTAAIPVNHLDATSQSAGTPAQLEVVLQGVTNQSHLVQVRINGTDLGTINFADTEHPSQTFSVPAAALLDGNNNVELTSLGGAADVSLVDVLRLTYIRSYVADNNALSFNLESRQTKRITGFTNDHIRLIDVTDPNEPLELTPHVVADGAGFAALVGVDAEVRAPFSRPHKLLAFVEGQTDAVDALRLNEPSSLWSETAGADYVMISTADLKASIEPLAQLRRNQGMVVQVVDVENLYDEFTFGEHSPRAIHDFLERAANTWTRQPHYLLLAGDASYDPKNYLGQGLNDLVPTKLIDTSLTETASDDWLADFNGDGIADLSNGRLPVRTVAETEALVSKFISYENMAPDPSRGALLVADTNFEGSSSAVQGMLPAGLPVQTINRAAGDDNTTHNQIIASLNQGPRVANYYGHGSNGVWTGAGLLSSNDAPALANTNRLSVFTMMTCFNGYFQDAYNDSLSEALLKSQGGAVAVWASTTLTEPAGQNVIGAEFYRLLFGPQPITLGDAARSARIATTDADVRRTWTLFGDPAMRLR